MLAEVAAASVYDLWEPIREHGEHLCTNPHINMIPSGTTLLPTIVNVFRNEIDLAQVGLEVPISYKANQVVASYVSNC